MEQAKPSVESDAIHGIVVTVPSNRRLPQALVRFFELRSNADRARRFANANWILEKGTSVGSCITDDKGEFSIGYCAPNADASLAFVVVGPDSGSSCEVLAWSCYPRAVARTGEVFLIGVNESRLAEQRHSAERDEIDALKKAHARRQARIAPSKATPVSERLANLQLTKSHPDGAASAQGTYVDTRDGTDKAREVNEKLIREAHKTRDKKPKIAAVPIPLSSKGVDRKLQKANKTIFGMAAINARSEVMTVVDQLRPLIRIRQQQLSKQSTKGVKDDASADKAPRGSSSRGKPRMKRLVQPGATKSTTPTKTPAAKATTAQKQKQGKPRTKSSKVQKRREKQRKPNSKSAKAHKRRTKRRR